MRDTTTRPTRARAYNGGSTWHLIDQEVTEEWRTLCGRDATAMARFRPNDLPSGERSHRTCEDCEAARDNLRIPHPALDAPVPYVTTGERWTPRDGLDELLEAGWTLDSALAHLDGTCDRALCTGTHEGDPADLVNKAADAWRDALLAAHQAGYLLGRSMRAEATESDQDRAAHAKGVATEAEVRAWRAFQDAVAR